MKWDILTKKFDKLNNETGLASNSLKQFKYHLLSLNHEKVYFANFQMVRLIRKVYEAYKTFNLNVTLLHWYDNYV